MQLKVTREFNEKPRRKKQPGHIKQYIQISGLSDLGLKLLLTTDNSP